MDLSLYNNIFTVFCFVVFPTCKPDSVGVSGGNQIDVVAGNISYSVQTYNIPISVNHLSERLEKMFEIIYEMTHMFGDEFRFKQAKYEVDAKSGFIGILAHFQVETDERDAISYGLASDDVYINKVFKMSPYTGILYADSAIDVGRYSFNVTADIVDKSLHAVAQVFVNVTGSATEANEGVDLISELFKFPTRPPPQQDFKLATTQAAEDEEFGNVNTNEIYVPARANLWHHILKKGFASGLTYLDVKDILLGRGRPSADKERVAVFNHYPLSDDIGIKRRRRAVPKSGFPTVPSKVNAAAAQLSSHVQSQIIYHESKLEDVMMSGFLIFVVSGAILFFFGSICYFTCKRIKKCGDYSVDEDAKSTTKPSDDETVYSTVQSEIKNPNILRVADIHQKRVVDSIEITKQKLAGQPTVFTLQKTYEQNALNNAKRAALGVDNEVLVPDEEQLRPGTGNGFCKRVLHRSKSSTIPTITASLVNGQEVVPQSILSTNRRNSTSSPGRKEANLLGVGEGGNGEDVGGGAARRKSVTFSDIIELYHVDQIVNDEATAKNSKK